MFQIFFLEGDNLLLRPVDFLASVYKIRELEIDASITHISFHASFMGFDFVQQLNVQALMYSDFTKKWLTGSCFLTGGGQDMRLGYEGARMLQVQRYLHPSGPGGGRRDGRISV